MRPSLDNIVSFGVAHLGLDGRLLAANRKAMAILNERDGLCLKDGRLSVTNPRDERRLRAVIGEPGTLASAGESYRADVISRKRSRQPLLVVGFPATDRITMIIQDPDKAPAYPERLVGIWLGLTRREAQLASLLASGMSIETAADQLNISTGTARSHIRHVFNKCGITRQNELVALICSIVPPFDLDYLCKDEPSRDSPSIKLAC